MFDCQLKIFTLGNAKFLRIWEERNYPELPICSMPAAICGRRVGIPCCRQVFGHKRKPGKNIRFYGIKISLWCNCEFAKRFADGGLAVSFQFQRGAIVSSVIFETPVVNTVFQFQLGAIVRNGWSINGNFDTEFQFQFGAIVRVQSTFHTTTM